MLGIQTVLPASPHLRNPQIRSPQRRKDGSYVTFDISSAPTSFFSRKRSLALPVLVALTMALMPAATANARQKPTPSVPPRAPSSGQIFAASSPFNVPIVAAPVVDSASPGMVAHAARTGQMYSNLYQFGVPIFTASSGSPVQSVTCRETGWGVCPFAGKTTRIPHIARPNSGSDGAMVTVDTSNGQVNDFWQATHSGTRWSASWGAVNSLSGSGWGGAATGSGASRLGGVIRVSEIQAGSIPHALVVQTDNVCAGNYRAPALKTDGFSSRTDCLPEGARLQLDPTADVSGLPSGERAVARALQVYGAYVIDNGGAPMSVSFELAPDATPTYPGSVYTAAGFSWDFYGMNHIPWHSLRVLKAWNT